MWSSCANSVFSVVQCAETAQRDTCSKCFNVYPQALQMHCKIKEIAGETIDKELGQVAEELSCRAATTKAEG
eukprot:5808994-Amphidinium_carterae.1